MAKKANKRAKKAQVNPLPENMLPQNILPIGERVEENKNIYISQAAYKEIHKFTINKTINESGGMLIGTVVEEFGKTNIVINGFVEAKFCEATPTTLKFTHNTWDYVHKEIDKKFKGQKIVGWIHTHPNFGIFLSEYDKFIQENFFGESYQIAYVVDPIQDLEGFYFWINGNLERCKGFYIFDKNGAKIDVATEPDATSAGTKRTKSSSGRGVLTTILLVAVAIMMFYCLSLNSSLKELRKQQKDVINAHNNLVVYLSQNGFSGYIVMNPNNGIYQLVDNYGQIIGGGSDVYDDESYYNDEYYDEGNDGNITYEDPLLDDGTEGAIVDGE